MTSTTYNLYINSMRIRLFLWSRTVSIEAVKGFTVSVYYMPLMLREEYDGLSL